MAQITLQDVQNEAERRGYRVTMTTTRIRAAKEQFTHVKRSFARIPDLSLAPQQAADYALLQVYYWIRGYLLDSGDDGKVVLHRGMHHPAYNQAIRVAETFDYFDYRNLAWLHQAMQQWVEQVEQVTAQEGKEE
jgi:hypothetical protein